MKNMIDIMGDISWLLYEANKQPNPRHYAMGKRGTVYAYIAENNIDKRSDAAEIAGHIRYMADMVLK